ncbi:regucalcin-like [Anoplophora glabripennis]|uniref:regucalcin-like n=1 Tax=Anoplophora glabripennis TaxID=217634 RepID=UPI00087360BF|nr:regucalcin-like [Anoplophora glabripennis]
MKCLYLMCLYFLIQIQLGSLADDEVMMAECRAIHIDGIFCDIENEMLYYIDTFAATVYKQYDWHTIIKKYKLEGRNSAAVIIPFRKNNDELIVAADRYLYKLTWPNLRVPNFNRVTGNGSIELLMKVDDLEPTEQFNYGKVDSKGRLWLGTIKRNKDLSLASENSNFYVFDGNDLGNFRKIATNVTNGMTWSNDGKRLYTSVSSQRLVFCYDFEEKTGSIDDQRIVFDMRNHPKLTGTPYGMTTDSSDNLWIALYEGHRVINVNPRTSKVIKVIEMFATYLTSVCLGGFRGNLLYVGTSKRFLNASILRPDDRDLLGCVLAVYVKPAAKQSDKKFNGT